MQGNRGAEVAGEEGLDVQISLVLGPVSGVAAERINERCEEFVLGGIRIPCYC